MCLTCVCDVCERGRETDRQTDRKSVCVCVHVRVYGSVCVYV